MRIFRLSPFLLLLVASLWIAAGRVCTAQEIKFPEKSPLVSFTLPDGWLTDEESNSGPIVRDCNSSATVKFRLRLLKETYSDADFRQKMSDLIQANLNSFGIAPESQDLPSIKMASRPLGDKIQAVYCEVKLKSTVLDEPYLMRVAGFTVDGKSMLAICGMEESARKSAADFDRILGSFKPAK